MHDYIKQQFIVSVIKKQSKPEIKKNSQNLASKVRIKRNKVFVSSVW